METLRAAVLAAVSFLLPMQGEVDTMVGFTVDPDPPLAGKKVTITYAPNERILIEWTPGGSTQGTCDANGEFSVTVPANANYMLVMDASDPSISDGWTVKH
jgi:hypothetical protein